MSTSTAISVLLMDRDSDYESPISDENAQFFIDRGFDLQKKDVFSQETHVVQKRKQTERKTMVVDGETWEAARVIEVDEIPENWYSVGTNHYETDDGKRVLYRTKVQQLWVATFESAPSLIKFIAYMNSVVVNASEYDGYSYIIYI